MLDRLAVLGMCLAEETVQRAVDSPYHPEPKHEPARAFAQVSRTVRFTLVLQSRVEEQILALRKGEPAPSLVPDRDANQERRTCAVRDDDLADDGDADDDEAPRHETGCSRENLREREVYDELPDLPFSEGVAAIRADLGLEPDHGERSDEVSRAVQPGKPNTTPLIPANAGTRIIGSGLAGGP